ncbi:hypothetical protein WDJ51_14220 [Rathayibacter sp. YIM 133350]|uniref:hypothetical protein n=1 Tax=Rathayibacter sp. YIM 133350 TaxID=3131992 RepID=UPI00307D2467
MSVGVSWISLGIIFSIGLGFDWFLVVTVAVGAACVVWGLLRRRRWARAQNAESASDSSQ